MICSEPKKKIAPQTCPLCNSQQDVIINGWGKSENGVVYMKDILEDKGYSFCHCRNVFFTDWSNINQGTYDPEYYKKYDQPFIDAAYRRTFNYKYQAIKDSLYFNSPFAPKVLDVGSINKTILDCFKEKGFNTYGLDICDHPLGSHELIVGDFEKVLPPIKVDVIWASHVFEHFQAPVEAVKQANSLLNDGGILYVAMPDPYFIDFDDPYKWAHWHLREHHIIWDMDSFCEVLRENGFEIISKERNTHTDTICSLDYGIIAKKRIDVEHYN